MTHINPAGFAVLLLAFRLISPTPWPGQRRVPSMADWIIGEER